VTRWQDLVIRQAAPPLQHDPSTGQFTCEDETAFSLALRAGERRLFHADLAGGATLVVGACSQGAGPASPRALRVHVTYADGRQEEYRRELPRGWSTAALPLAAPRPGRVRLRLATEVPDGEPVFLRDLAVRAETPAAPPRAARRAILISLDAVREDALGATGGAARTPHLDRLAAEAERFHPHWAAEISTKPSHASMLTGLPAAVHGCDRGETPLAEEISTLAERLAAARVSTGAFLSVAPFFHPRYRLDQGFGTYRLVAWSAAQELREAGEWLAGHRDEPFFLFVHLYGAHSDFARLPYEAAGVSRRTVEEVFGVADYGCQGDLCASRRLAALQHGEAAPLEHESEIVRFLYDRGVESLDADLGAFFEELRRGGLWEDTLIVVTADHGEQFGERGRWMHDSLHEETLRVPLLVKWPRGARAGAVTERPSASIDLAPTILAHFGLAADDLPGRDLARAAAEAPGERAMVSFEAVRVGDRKLILGPAGRPEALFDLAADPGETRNLLPGGEAEAERLRGVWRLAHERARRLTGAPGAAAARPFTAEETERLRSLGYLR
jgi:arylsulfatase A-like enzyme